MSFWQRLLGKPKTPPAPEIRPTREVPDGAMREVQMLGCDPAATDPHRRFFIGKWGLDVVDEAESQRYAESVLKRSAGKKLRLEPNAEVGHRGVISSVKQAGDATGYQWIYVDVNLREGTIRFHQGRSGP